MALTTTHRRMSPVSMLGIRLHPSPRYSWFIRFTPGFTALSLFVPTMAFMVAFIFLGSQVEFVLWRVPLTGILVGGTIALMHVSRGILGSLFVSTPLLSHLQINLLTCTFTLPLSIRPLSNSRRSQRVTRRTQLFLPFSSPASLRRRPYLSSSDCARSGRITCVLSALGHPRSSR